jgi:phosphatidyl-myo-inositol alpha-mannosyltransferase
MNRILVITPFFYPHIGGSEKYMERLYVFLKKNNSEIQVDVLCYNTDNAKKEEKYKGLNIFRVPCFVILQDQFALPNPFSIIKFLLIKGGQYDLIHCSTRFFDPSWWAPVYAKLARKKIILTDHCSAHPVHKTKLGTLVARFVDLTVVRFFLRFYNKIYSENKKNKEFLKNTFGINSVIAYPGLEPNLYKKKRVNKRPKVVFVGRLIESKGVRELFEIGQSLPEADFVFAGTGALSSEFYPPAGGQSSKFRNIHMTGALGEREVEKLLSESDIFAYPSSHSEGLPISILEAGKYGLCVVAMNSGAINEVIIDKKTGILVEAQDFDSFKRSIEKTINYKSLREKLGKSLEKNLTNMFYWKGTVSKIIIN